MESSVLCEVHNLCRRKLILLRCWDETRGARLFSKKKKKKKWGARLVQIQAEHKAFGELWGVILSNFFMAKILSIFFFWAKMTKYHCF